MKNITTIHDFVKNNRSVTVGIAGATEEEILIAKEAIKEKIANFIFVGNEKRIRELLEKHGLPHADVSIYNVDLPGEEPEKVMDLLKKGEIHIPMKGQVHTGTFVKSIIKKENGLVMEKRLSQVTVFDGYNDSLQFLTDCAINVEYSLEIKVILIKNAVEVARKFGIETPKVALLGAIENISKNMPDTFESAIITQMNRRGEIEDCIIDGPLGLDNAISEKYAKIKNIDSPVAGKADILVATSLNEANSLSKGIIHYANRDACSVIAGTRSPIIMTSRTDTLKNKLNSISVACYLYQKEVLVEEEKI